MITNKSIILESESSAAAAAAAAAGTLRDPAVAAEPKALTLQAPEKLDRGNI